MKLIMFILQLALKLMQVPFFLPPQAFGALDIWLRNIPTCSIVGILKNRNPILNPHAYYAGGIRKLLNTRLRHSCPELHHWLACRG